MAAKPGGGWQWPDWVSAAEKAGLEGTVGGGGGETILQWSSSGDWRHLTSHSQTDLGRGLSTTGYSTYWLSQVMSEILRYIDIDSIIPRQLYCCCPK